MKQTASRLKFLTPELAVSLHTFNDATRTLQRMGIRLHCIDPSNNRLTLSPEDGRRLESLQLLAGYQRHGTAGSTRYVARFQGVEVTWSEPISYLDYRSPKSPSAPADLTFF